MDQEALRKDREKARKDRENREKAALKTRLLLGLNNPHLDLAPTQILVGRDIIQADGVYQTIDDQGLTNQSAPHLKAAVNEYMVAKITSGVANTMNADLKGETKLGKYLRMRITKKGWSAEIVFDGNPRDRLRKFYFRYTEPENGELRFSKP